MYATIHTIAPFDSSVGTNINFTWSGNQIYKVRCIIKNNATGVTAYDSTIDTMKQVYILPPTPTLINGTKYVAYITVFDVNNNESTIQNIGTPFYCFTTPTFNLSVSNGDIIRASSYSIGLTYSQVESELLNWFNITLYSYQKTLVDSSGQIYDTTNLSYIVSNLQNATQYYIRATGETVNGMSLDTGYVLVTVSYTTAQVFSTLELNNISDTGAIEIKSNIISAEGESESDVTYIDGESADLRDNSVIFKEGFLLDGDFTKIYKFSKATRNKSIITFGTTDGLTVNVYYRIGSWSDSDGEKAYFELVANSCGINYISNSGYVATHSDDYHQYSLLINRVNGLFDLKAEVVSSVIRYSASADGSNMTTTKQSNSAYVGVCDVPDEIITLWESSGRNLLRYSDFKELNSSWYSVRGSAYSLSIDDNITNGHKSLKIIGNAAGQAGQDIQFKTAITANDGEHCVLSFYAKSNVECVLSARWGLTSSYKIVQVTNEWIKYTMELPRNLSQPHDSIYIIFNKIGEFYINSPKLERGSTATPWTPAPSDYISDNTNYTWTAL